MTFDLVVVAGQSNAVGCGRPVAPRASQPADPRLWQYTQATAVGPAPGQIVPLTEPLYGIGSDGSEGAGPAPEFCRVLAPYYNRTFLVNPCAYGGTGLVHGRWSPFDHEVGDLYVNMIKTTRALLSKPDVRFFALIWLQGEYDSLGSVSGADYRWYLDTLIDQFRTDIDVIDAPVMIGSMVPSWINTAGNGTAAALHSEMYHAPSRRPGVQFVQGPDGPGQDAGGIHYTAAQARELGRRMAYNFQMRPLPPKVPVNPVGM